MITVDPVSHGGYWSATITYKTAEDALQAVRLYNRSKLNGYLTILQLLRGDQHCPATQLPEVGKDSVRHQDHAPKQYFDLLDPDEKIPKRNSAAQVRSEIGFRKVVPEKENFSSQLVFERVKKSKVTNPFIVSNSSIKSSSY